MEWLLGHPEQLAGLKAYDNLYGLQPERDDMRAMSMASRTVNALKNPETAPYPYDHFYYLKAQVPDRPTIMDRAKQLSRQLKANS
jgi:hypothetical protein